MDVNLFDSSMDIHGYRWKLNDSPPLLNHWKMIGHVTSVEQLLKCFSYVCLAAMAMMTEEDHFR